MWEVGGEGLYCKLCPNGCRRRWVAEREFCATEVVTIFLRVKTGRLTYYCVNEYPTELSLRWGDTMRSASGLFHRTNKYERPHHLYRSLSCRRLLSTVHTAILTKKHHEDLFLASLPHSPRSERLCARLVVDVDSSHDRLECHGRS